MIDWLFNRKKKAAPRADEKTARKPGAERAARAPAAAAAPLAARPAAQDWDALLANAQGSDDALLALACGAAPVHVKLAALDAITSEETLKRAERELRKHDRRVHRRAKQRHAERGAQRETQAHAAQLIASARAMHDELPIAANRLVELELAWQALDPALLADTQASDFAALFARLTALERERADRARDLVRWLALAREAGFALDAACAQAAAASIDRAALDACVATAQAALDAAPGDDEATAAGRDTLREALRTAAGVAQRLEILDALSQTAQHDDREGSPPPPESDGDAAVTDHAAGVTDRAPGVTDRAAGLTYCAPDVTDRAAGLAHRAAHVTDRAAGLEVRAAGVTDLAAGAGADPEAARLPAMDDAARRWGALAPLANSHLASTLDTRFAQAQRAQTAQTPAPVSAPARRAAAAEAAPARRALRVDALARSVEQVEAALAEGRLADIGRPLSAIEQQLRDTAAPPALRERIDALRAEAARLRGWQDWGGARARDDLLAQAEALAAVGADATDVALARLSSRQRGELIAELRARWKELDRHGGGAPRAMWQRFDAALQAAHAPLAAQFEARRTARESNLQARIELLAALEAVPLPGGDEAGTGNAAASTPTSAPSSAPAPAPASASASTPASAAAPAPEPVPTLASASVCVSAPERAPETEPSSAPASVHASGLASASAATPGLATSVAAAAAGPATATSVPEASPRDAAPDARSLAVALSGFYAAWRKLGPVEHTVPHAERERVVERMNAAVARLDGPLSEARRSAQAQREALIASARALAAPGAAQGRDAAAALRALQSRWQQAARALPLARAAEAALWSDFRAAIDAAYAALHARAAARDAEFEAGAAARGALIARIEETARAVADDGTSDTATFERTLAEVDAQWRRAGAAPRASGAALDARYRAARAAAQALLRDAPRRRWRLQCEALAARLAEPGAAQGDAPSATEPAPHAALPALPAQWESALERRGLPPAGAMSNDDLLLRLEAAFGVDSPPEMHEARRLLKLHAMKAALEARSTGAPAAPDALLVEALARGTLDAAQRDRLRAVVAALAETPPGPA